MFQKIGNFLRALQGYSWFALSVVPAIAAYAAGVYEGRLWSERILITVATLASGMILVHYALVTYDFIVERLGARKEINQIIEHLRNLADVGHDTISVESIAEMWAGDDVGKGWVYNPKLRKIKKAMEDRRINYVGRSAGNEPNKKSAAVIKDVIAYFESIKGG